MICPRSMPSSSASLMRILSSRTTSATVSPKPALRCMVRGVPRMWLITTGTPRSAAQAAQPGIAQAGYVVDHRRPRFERRFRHRSLAGVDRHRRPASRRDRGDRRNHASYLFLGAHRGGTGAGRLTANIDQVGTLPAHAQRGLRHFGGIQAPACRDRRNRVVLIMPMTSARW